jgi:ditrans,polycis-polyprenyl diphosphate synthase
MSSWYSEEKPSYSILDAMILRLLTCGPVPNHVAFIMDGNRRFARANGIKTFEGHSLGFDKMAEVLMWCDDLGIKEITVYAFRYVPICNVSRRPVF